MSWGNKPTDGGNFILSPEERADLIETEPNAGKFIRPYMGGHDFINGEERYCLWLVNADPNELRKLPQMMKRVEAVSEFRAASKAESTRRYSKFPTLFRQIAQPDSDYLAVPEVSSENRPYIPIAFVGKKVICSNTIQFVPNATPYHFGILTSAMHMAWVRLVCGRLKSDYRYSNSLVYNNFPWPEKATDKQRAAVEGAAQTILDVRGEYLRSTRDSRAHPGDPQDLSYRIREDEDSESSTEAFPNQTATLADLYDPLSMPPRLVKAHAALDRAVDLCYRPAPFPSERQRVEHLFVLYEKLTAPLLPATKPRRGSRR